jgi:hypothetical protein
MRTSMLAHPLRGRRRAPSVLISQVPQCATIWVEHERGEELQPFGVESLLVDTRRKAHKNLSHLSDFFSTRVCRVLSQEC